MFLAKGSGIRFLVRDQGVQVEKSEVEGGRHDPRGNGAASSY